MEFLAATGGELHVSTDVSRRNSHLLSEGECFMVNWRVLVCLGAAMLPVLLQAVPAEAAPVIVEGGISITTGSNNRCLDADLGTIGGNGTRVQLWDCNGWDNQKWDLFDDGSIRNRNGGRCLDADLGTIGGNGTRVQLWDCNGWNNQKWIRTGAVFVNTYNNRCLDADLGTIGGNGTRVQLWNCNGWNNQKWFTMAPAMSLCRADLGATQVAEMGVPGFGYYQAPVDIHPGDVVRITATGTVDYGGWPTRQVWGPDGNGTRVSGGSWAFQGGIAYSLFGEWGRNVSMFQAGSNSDCLTAPTAGPGPNNLLLSTNDERIEDNKGSYQATVRLFRA
jgi:hypothetical protein